MSMPVALAGMKRLCWTVAVMVLAGCGGTSPSAPSGSAESPQVQVSSAKAPDEKAAIDAIAKINEAQTTYFKLNRRYGLTFDELTEAHLLSSEPTAAQTGYDFKLRPAADAQTYKLLVVPTDSSAMSRHFFADESGAIHAELGKDATVDSPKI